MYCKKCKFHSFDHVSACPKCGTDWEDSRKALYLNWITATGVNWLAQEAATQAPASATPKPDGMQARSGGTSEPSKDYLAAPEPPMAAAAASTEIDVSNFPELDFSMAESIPEPPATNIAAPAKNAPAPKPEEELFLDTIPAEDMVELDFSASFETPTAPQAPAQARTKREDLFIPELEEMLAPLDDEPRSKPAQAKKPSFSEEAEILLDFGTDPAEGSSGKGGDDLSFLSLEDPKKPS
ncbi:MAG: hypothetical protein AB7D27_04635 [Desulfomicrobium sp.]